jgi:hypothetical protein
MISECFPGFFVDDKDLERYNLQAELSRTLCTTSSTRRTGGFMFRVGTLTLAVILALTIGFPSGHWA